ncbi:MAG: carboxylesterase family protein [Bacteroidota bacterium]
MKKLLSILILPVLILTSCSSGKKSTSGFPIDITSVPTEAGLISGKTNTDETVNIFMGVPFAAPPVGDLRWKAPQPPLKWDGVRECVTPPPSAMQAPPNPFMMWTKEFMAPLEPLSEDCLYLNIWTPAKSTGEKLPVMVWIHGGAFTGGSGTVPLYDGEEICKKGIVYVSINYRLGVFGFLAHPELTAESPLKTSGNYGILDQIESLKWISRNIEAFGGDPGNVTIAGQSAGSFSVNALVISPLAKGLFHRAIGQSGGMFGGGPGLVNDLKASESAGVKYAEQLKAASINELRLKSAEELMKVRAQGGIVIDNIVMPDASGIFASGKQNDVPLIAGWNADDGFSMASEQNVETFRKEAEKRYGEYAPDYLKAFPAANDEDVKKYQKITSVLSFGWQNYNWVKMQSTTGKGKAYLYYFTHVPPGEPNYGAFHSAEFGYALKTLRLWDKPFTQVDWDLTEKMSSYWVNFAKTGDPNGEGLPEWPAFDKSSPKLMEFGDEVKSVPLPFKEQLEFFDKYNNR